MMMPAPRRFPDAPSPLGLAMAAVGLILLCVSVLTPRLSVQSDDEDQFSFYNYTALNGEASLLGAETALLVVALLAAVGVSAAKAPAWRWPARITAVALATVSAAFAYHPISALRELLNSYEGFDGESIEFEVTAESGLYLLVFAVALLAASTFFMHVKMNRAAYQASPPPPAAPGPGQGPTPTVTVTPG